MFFPSTSHAQSGIDIPTFFPSDFRSQIVEEWDGGSWAGQFRVIQTFDEGNVVENVTQGRENGAWVNVSRTVNTYDDSDRLVEAEMELWDESAGAFEKQSRTTNTYNNGNIAQVLVESWDGSDWQNAGQTLNSYDGDDNLVEVLEQIWTGGSWQIQTRTQNTYDGDGRLTETIVQQFGINQSRTTNTYSGNNLVETVEQTWDIPTNDWENESRTLYEDFDGNAFPMTVTEQIWNSNTGSWENDTRDLNTFNGTSLTETITQVWDGSMFNDSSRTAINYDGTLIDEVVEETWDGSDWVNANRTAISYDTMDRVTAILSQSWGGSAWENEDRTRYSYDDILPVELTAFTATRADEAAQLRWTTASETNNAGFEVERRVGHGGAFTQIGFVEGKGTTSEAQHYRFTDDQVPFEAVRVTYRLRQVDFDGTHAYSPMVELNLRAPERLALHANYPNPFRSQTTIRYELPQAGPAQLAVYNILGQQVAQLLNGQQPAGRGEVMLQSALPSGVYFLRLEARGKSETRQITVVK